MKLNYDCVRDTLIYLETLDRLNSDGTWNIAFFCFDNLPKILTEKYDAQDIMYSLIKLEENNYISASIVSADNAPEIIFNDITYDGHEFLNNIKDANVWSKTKELAKKVVTGASLSALSNIASQIIQATLTNPPF